MAIKFIQSSLSNANLRERKIVLYFGTIVWRTEVAQLRQKKWEGGFDMDSY